MFLGFRQHKTEALIISLSMLCSHLGNFIKRRTPVSHPLGSQLFGHISLVVSGLSESLVQLESGVDKQVDQNLAEHEQRAAALIFLSKQVNICSLTILHVYVMCHNHIYPLQLSHLESCKH